MPEYWKHYGSPNGEPGNLIIHECNSKDTTSPKLPLLERDEANLLLEVACFEVNSIPYGLDDEIVYLCPNDIIAPK